MEMCERSTTSSRPARAGTTRSPTSRCSIDTATIRNQHELLRGINDNDHGTEEPDKAQALRPVLKAGEAGDSPRLASDREDLSAAIIQERGGGVHGGAAGVTHGDLAGIKWNGGIPLEEGRTLLLINLQYLNQIPGRPPMSKMRRRSWICYGMACSTPASCHQCPYAICGNYTRYCKMLVQERT